MTTDITPTVLESRWALHEREDGTAQVYSTSLGPMRQCVPVAETTVECGREIVRLHNAAIMSERLYPKMVASRRMTSTAEPWPLGDPPSKDETTP